MRYLTATIVLMLLVSALAACGPTARGKEMRGEASNRLDLVNAQVSYDQARRSFEVGQFDRALREINSAIARYPAVPAYHILQGRIYLETHRLEPAMRAFNEALELDDELAEPAYFAGIVFQRWSRHEDAFKKYMMATEADPSNAQYLLAAAEAQIALGDFSAARELIHPRLSYFEHHSAMHHLLGRIATLEDNPEHAEKLLSEARLLNPDDLLLLEELAWVQYEAGMYGRCHETLQLLSRLSSEERDDWRLLKARCLVRLERFIEARALYVELTNEQSGNVDIWIEFGAVAMELGDMRRLDLCARRVRGLAPNRYEGYLLQAMYDWKQGNNEQAIRNAREAASRTQNSALPNLFLGRALEEEGEIDSAMDAYAQALRVEPENNDADRLFRRLNQRTELSSQPTDR